MSDTASQKNPIANRTIPAISRLVPKAGLAPPLDRSETAGEFRMTVGRAAPQLMYNIVEPRRRLTDNPDPDDLECPESGELEEMGSHIVKPRVGTRLEDSEE